MRNLIFVAVGGALGASLRYAVGLGAGRWLGTAFPWGTLAVNVVGCFLMGLAGQWMLDWEPTVIVHPNSESRRQLLGFVRHGLAIGVLGGLTTFSAFGWDTFRQLQTGQPTLALANVAGNLILGLAAVGAGAMLARVLW
jgi:CrcB protein